MLYIRVTNEGGDKMTEDEQKVIFSTNLNHLLDKYDKLQKEVAADIGVTPQRFNQWVKGQGVPRMHIIQKLADYFNVQKTDLIDPPQLNSTSAGVRIPVLGDVAAGIPIEAIEDVLDYEDISVQLAVTGEFFGLRIHGNSMEPRICEGDVVIVRVQSDAESGKVVIVRIDHERVTCKRLKKYADGSIALISTNPQYEPMYFDEEAILTEPVEILGVVVENRQKY